MNRRELLKFTLLAPLVGLFKKKEASKEFISPSAQMHRAMVETSDTSGGDYTCWGFLDEEPEIYNDTSGEHPAYVVWWDSEENLSRFKRISNEEFYRLMGNEEERTLF